MKTTRETGVGNDVSTVEVLGEMVWRRMARLQGRGEVSARIETK